MRSATNASVVEIGNQPTQCLCLPVEKVGEPAGIGLERGPLELVGHEPHHNLFGRPCFPKVKIMRTIGRLDVQPFSEMGQMIVVEELHFAHAELVAVKERMLCSVLGKRRCRHEAVALGLACAQCLNRERSQPFGAGDGQIVKIVASIEVAMVGEHADIDHGIVDCAVGALFTV